MDNLITAARDRLNLGQAELADMLGVHRTTVTRWENGKPIKGPAKLLLENMLAKARRKKASAA